MFIPREQKNLLLEWENKKGETLRYEIDNCAKIRRDNANDAMICKVVAKSC